MISDGPGYASASESLSPSGSAARREKSAPHKLTVHHHTDAKIFTRFTFAVLPNLVTAPSGVAFDA